MVCCESLPKCRLGAVGGNRTGNSLRKCATAQFPCLFADPSTGAVVRPATADRPSSRRTRVTSVADKAADSGTAAMYFAPLSMMLATTGLTCSMKMEMQSIERQPARDPWC